VRELRLPVLRIATRSGGTVVGKCFGWIIMLALGSPFAAGQLPPMPVEPDADVEREPRLFVAELVRDLGAIIEGDKVVAEWRLENRGNADLIIEKTRAPCGCTVVRLAEEGETIAPGDWFDLKVEYDSRRRHGSQRASVTVYSNDPLEPTLKLELTANVTQLYNLTPSNVINLRSVKRGGTAKQTLDLMPAEEGEAVELLGVELAPGAPLTYAVEPFEAPWGPGRRIRFTVNGDAPMGTLSTRVTVNVKVGRVEKTREVRVRGEVVGDLTCQPKIVNATRHKSKRGKRLAPVAIQAMNTTPFEILSLSAGPVLDTTFEKVKRIKKRIAYNVYMTIRDDAPPGPFGTMLEVRTSSVDQPIIRVPVFAIVAEPIEVDPPVLLLRQDGTPEGRHRQVRIRAPGQETLAIADVASDNSAVAATISTRDAAAKHIVYLDVTLAGTLPEGTHDCVVTMSTGIEGARRVEIPVTVIVQTPGR
jgi:hypothetical protein